MEKIIHIHAKCDRFEIFEQLPEKKAERRLKQIREHFLYLRRRYGGGESFTRWAGRGKGIKVVRTIVSSDRLVVKTIVVNPTLL